MTVFISILVMLLILSVLTIIHEWGHFIAARIFKVKVTEFSIFMGPKIFSRVSKKTGTVFSVRCLPIGGFCAFEDDNGNADSPDSLNSQKWYKRAIIFSAGVIMNIVLALILSIVICIFTGYSTTEIVEVHPDSTAAFVGIEAGDRLYSIDGMRTVTLTDESLASYAIKDTNPADEIMDSHYTLVYKKKNGQKIHYDVSKHAEYGTTVDENGEKVYRLLNYTYTINKTYGDYKGTYVYRSIIKSYDDKTAVCDVKKTAAGVEMSSEEQVLDLSVVGVLGNSNYFYGKTYNPFKLVYYGFNEMVSMVKSVYVSLYWIVTGKVGLNAVSGPIGLTTVVEDVVSTNAASAALKILTLINLAALISANLGVFNFLPFPGLDGCHLLFIVIELIRGGKKIPPEKQGLISMIGLAVLIVLAVVIMGADIMRIINGESLI